MTKRISGVALVLSLALVCCIGVFALQEPAKKEEAPKPPLPNFSELTPRVGVAGQPTEAGIRTLAEKGYKAVINMRTAQEPVDLAAEEKLVTSLGMKYYHVPVVGTDLNDSQAEAFMKAMDELKSEKVVVHCASANRANGFMMIYRVLRDGVTVEQAEADARKAGMRGDTLPAFAKKVIEKQAAK